MEPYNTKDLFKEFIEDDELRKLLIDAYIIYGGYKYSLLTLKYDFKYFIDLMLINECISSINVKDNKISKNLLFYLNYMNKGINVTKIKNTKKTFLSAYKKLKETNEIDESFVHLMNKNLLKGTKIPTKDIAVYRKKQTYIMKIGLVGKTLDYVSPKRKDIEPSMKQIYENINSVSYNDPLTRIALSHFQFLTVHPYLEGNGRIDRLLIPLLFNKYLKEEPILFISESLDINKNTYFKTLSDAREGNYKPFVKYFLNMCIEQCSRNIDKIEKINVLYDKDMEYLKKEVGGSLIYKMYPYMARKVVFTVGDVVDDCKIHINSVNKVFKKLVSVGILTKSKEEGTNRITYRYNNMYELFIPTNKSQTPIL